MPIGKRLSALEPHKCMRTFFSSHGILAIQRSASCHVIVFWLFCTAAGLLLPPPSHARTCIASVANKNNLFHFLTGLVEGLGYAQISIQRYSGKTQGSPINSSLFSMLSVIKLAKEDLECAESQLDGYRGSSHASIRQSAEAVASLFARLSNLHGQTLFDFQAAIDSGPDNFDLRAFVAKQAARIATADAEWKKLVPAVVTAANMIFPNPPSTPYLPEIGLTPVKRGEILQQLKATFGDPITKGPARGHNAVVAAAAILYEALNIPTAPMH